MLEKNKLYEAVVTDYTAEGQGVAKIEGCAVFIPNAIRGERYTVRIEKVGKTWAAGKITEILEKSSHRLQRQCPISSSCGGCDFWHMDYEEETRLKAERVRQALNRIGGESLESMPILAAPTCLGYRNKAQYPVAARKGRVYAGFFKAGTHQVVENDRCLILPEETEQVKNIVVGLRPGAGVLGVQRQKAAQGRGFDRRTPGSSRLCHLGAVGKYPSRQRGFGRGIYYPLRPRLY